MRELKEANIGTRIVELVVDGPSPMMRGLKEEEDHGRRRAVDRHR
jgi:hypothetical protein